MQEAVVHEVLSQKGVIMALTINTNLSSLIVQSNLNKSTGALNQAIERMTTGYKINHAADNAAGYSIARNWEAKLGSLDVAADNAATGADMMSTLEDHYALVSTHVQRIRDLTEQAANGTYGTQSKQAIQEEIQARIDEIDRIAKNCEFGGQYLMNGDLKDATIAIQVGLDSNADKSQIALDGKLFKSGELEALFTDAGVTTARADIAKFCAGLDTTTGDDHVDAADMLVRIDKVIDKISERVTTLGAAQNRIESAIESINVQSENIMSSLSTLRDADVAEESSNYIKAQILQQASATLLATANQQPSIALNLL